MKLRSGPSLGNLSAPIGAEHDLSPPLDPGEGGDRYVICSTQRSGSGLLCRGLAATGIAGTPTEYFQPTNRLALAARWGCTRLPAYADALMSRRATPNRVFGTKLHWEHLQQIRAEWLGMPPGDPGMDVSSDFLALMFPGLRYVRILRLDIDRQAISLWTAARRGLTSLAAGERGGLPRVRYSFAGIARCRRIVAMGELHWDRFFRVNKIAPIEVVYEELAADYAATLRALVRRIVPHSGEIVLPPPESRRLSDDHSEALLMRFRDDLRARGPEQPLGPAHRGWRKVRRTIRALTGSAR